MPDFNIKPSHKAVEEYYGELEQFYELGEKHEGAVRKAFQDLLSHYAGKAGMHLAPEHNPKQHSRERDIWVDGGVFDEFNIPHGYWEAKDEADDLERAVRDKFQRGYPRDNIIFQGPTRAILVQNGSTVIDTSLDEPDALERVAESAWNS